MIGNLTNRVAIVTGATSGIGLCVAQLLQAHGAHVVYADAKPPVDPPPPPAAAAGCPGPAGDSKAIQCDVSHEPSVVSLIASTVAWKGRVDILCNFAGISTENQRRVKERLHECPSTDLDATLAVNLRGVWLCCKYALAQMLAQEALPANARGERPRGWIVNAASVLGQVAFPMAPCYVASKFAVVGLTKQIALDYAADRIHCNAVCPGFIDTPMNHARMETDEDKVALGHLHPWGTLGTAEDVASAVLFLVSPETSWTTGAALTIDGGLAAR